MMKSLVTNAQAVLRSLLKDVKAAYPTCSGLDKDESRLLALMSKRGIQSFMLDLPNLDNLLTRGLETGRLALSGPLSHAVSKEVRVPRLFSGLWLRIFSTEGVLKVDADATAIFLLRCLATFYKRLELECSKDRVSNAVKEYFDVESSLRSPSLLWADDEFDCFGVSHTLHFRDGMADAYVLDRCKQPEGSNQLKLLCDRLQRICDSVAGELGYYDPYSFTNEVGRSSTTGRTLGHGRGSVSDLRRHADKYALPSWSERLQHVFPHDAFGVYRFDNTLEYESWKNITPSKLIAVPKTLAKPRLIASEPTSAQWCQQITLRWLNQRMKETTLGKFLDLSNQKLSQDMVLLQSALTPGRERSATVDLSSASDRLTCWAIERAFRKNPTLLSALQASRTPLLTDGVTGCGEFFLKKFASQGTAVTFPIQSIFFLCCILASLGCNTLSDAKKWIGKVRVYGDDLIIPVSGYENLRLLLTFLELKINEDKSFVNGQFRESCGMDAWNGVNVTPPKPKTLVYRGPKSERAILDICNNLWNMGLWHTSKCLESIIPGYKYPVVRSGLGAIGRVSFCGSDLSHLKSRWNKGLHRREVLCRLLVDKTKRTPFNSTSGIFQFFAENPSQDQKWSSGASQEARLITKSGWVDVSDFTV